MPAGFFASPPGTLLLGSMTTAGPQSPINHLCVRAPAPRSRTKGAQFSKVSPPGHRPAASAHCAPQHLHPIIAVFRGCNFVFCDVLCERVYSRLILSEEQEAVNSKDVKIAARELFRHLGGEARGKRFPQKDLEISPFFKSDS